jgi:hypothetical protein
MAYPAGPAPPPRENVPGAAEEEDEETADQEDRRLADAAKKKAPGFSLIPRAQASTKLRDPEPTSATPGVVRFGIDLGSFRRYSQAQSAAKKAYYSVPDAYRSGSTRIAVVPTKHGRKTQYAARVLGFNESAASQTCRHLAKRGLRCHTLSYSLQSASLHSTSDVPDANDDDGAVAKPKPKAKKHLAKKRKTQRYIAYRQ